MPDREAISDAVKTVLGSALVAMGVYLLYLWVAQGYAPPELLHEALGALADGLEALNEVATFLTLPLA